MSFCVVQTLTRARSAARGGSRITNVSIVATVRGHVVISGLAAVLLTLLISATAKADVRSGSVQDPIDHQPSGRSLNEQPTVTEITGAAVTYDQQAGSVTVAVTFNRSLDEDRLAAFRFSPRSASVH
jgi:hypothetical protein